ncbi:Uncharacterised protein [Plesiomonas shigelloides]|nr:Uncharacterised protein [Plesiomonas shigelloides]
MMISSLQFRFVLMQFVFSLPTRSHGQCTPQDARAMPRFTTELPDCSRPTSHSYREKTRHTLRFVTLFRVLPSLISTTY